MIPKRAMDRIIDAMSIIFTKELPVVPVRPINEGEKFHLFFFITAISELLQSYFIAGYYTKYTFIHITPNYSYELTVVIKV